MSPEQDHLQNVDSIMEQASLALMRMDYLDCEAHCLKALALTRQQQDWANYARVLLPLQETRRQRRMIAAEGVIRIGTADRDEQEQDQAEAWLEQMPNGGCMLVTQPYAADQAAKLARAAKAGNQYVEVLYADNATDASSWILRSFDEQIDDGPAIECKIDAPPAPWLNRWLNHNGAEHQTGEPNGSPGKPADWFLDACEALGDAALAQVPDMLDPLQRIKALEQCLGVVTDHEILHQRLWQAARKAALMTTS